VLFRSRAYDATMKFLNIDTKGSDDFVKAERLKQKAVADTRKLNEQAAAGEAIIAEQREIISDKETYTYAQRLAALRVAQKEEQKLSNARVKNAEINLKALKAEAALDDANAEMNDKISAAIVNVSNAKKENAALGRKLGKEAQKLSDENIADMKAEADAAAARDKKILDAKRRLVDSQFALLADSQEKDIKISNETNKRKIEDLQASGELTNALQKNLTTAQQTEIAKIKKDWAGKRLGESIKADELTLENMKKAGQYTLSFEKDLLNQRMEAEILAGGSALEIKQKYKFLELDLEAKTADEKAVLFEKELTKQTDLLSAGYKKQEIELKKNYSKTKQTAEDKAQFESDLADIQLNALKDVNQKTIDGLRLQLENFKGSADKKAELSKKLRDLEIENDNAVLDAKIKNNEKGTKSDEDVAEKRKAIIMALANAGAEIFGAIADFQNQQSETRIAGLEAEQEALDSTFEKDQENLDNAIMSDETRAEKQKAINEKKAAADKVIADKIQAEKIKQAKWDKANAIAQAIISAGLGILNAALTKPFVPLGLIAAGLAATMGAIQVATIVSQPIPAFEKGGVTGDGLALWGETRPEVAVDPKGNVMLAEEPTISNFDAGTRIYKSVSDYEAAMGQKGGQAFKFDYDKMGEKMRPAEINLDSRGLWGIISKQQSRSTMINRRYRL